MKQKFPRDCSTCNYGLNGLHTLNIKSKTCQKCVWYDNHPNYKIDVRLNTHKLDEFTVEKYPQYL
jgi:hypothetical protein